MRMRQPTAIHTAFSAPGNPVVLIKGEKAKASSPGAVVLIHIELRPNTAPRIPPASGPSSTAPRITGMCRVVALMTGSGIRPMPVATRTSSTATIIASSAIHRVCFLRFFIFNSLLLSLLSGRMQRIFVRGPALRPLNRIIITKLSPDCKAQIF